MKKQINFMKKQLNFMKKQLNLMKSILLNFMKKQLSFFFMTYQWRKHNNKTNYFCENWNFSLKMIALILILVSKTSKSKAKLPEQVSNVSKASKDWWRNQKFQHWNKQKAWFITKLQPATARWNSLPYQRRNQEEMQLKKKVEMMFDEWFNQWREMSPKYITVDLSLHTSLIGKPNKFLML